VPAQMRRTGTGPATPGTIAGVPSLLAQTDPEGPPCMTSTPEATAQVGVVGLAVMGRNLARNFANHGYTVAVYNRTTARTDEMIAAHGEEGNFVPSAELADFVASLERPRR